jgi:arylsulfatase A-like enzyme
MKRLLAPLLVLLMTLPPAAQAAQKETATGRPRNIVLIYADDIGYGDFGCYGATKVKTPQVDALARQGLRFTDAHSPAATCTPSRYSLLTGEYAWRKRGTNILPGDANLIIEPDRPTLASVLKSSGYTTGVVGKWHLGLGNGPINWNEPLKPGPAELGFDYSFIIPATGDRTPCVFVENGRVVNLDPADPIQVSYQKKIGEDPTGAEHPELLTMKPSHGHDQTIVNGISRIGYMSGGKTARWKDEEIAETINRKAVDFIEANRDKPFFLYFSTHDVHVPRVPGRRFAGSSQDGTRGDVIQEFDGSVGEVVAALDRLGLAADTLLIVTSDNGPVLDDGYDDTAKRQEGLAPAAPMVDTFGHTPAGNLRGRKSTAYEAGTRVPCIARWPGKIEPGVSDALVSQVDLLPTLAALVGAPVPVGAAPDGMNQLPTLLGKDSKGREVLIEQGRSLGVRRGNWKLVLPPGPRRRADGADGKPELYDLSKDLAEQHDLAAEHPEIVAEMMKILEDSGVTAPPR